jgi:hypothetical protein
LLLLLVLLLLLLRGINLVPYCFDGGYMIRLLKVDRSIFVLHPQVCPNVWRRGL